METSENSKNQNQQFIIALIALALCFGIYIFFNPPGGGSTPIPVVKTDTVLVFINTRDSNEIKDPKLVCVDCVEETVCQPIDHFFNVLENYRKNIWDSVNNNSIFRSPSRGLNFASLALAPNTSTTTYDKTDARCIWFSLETLKQFICTIETNNAKLNIPAEDLGIRFYYAAYPMNYVDVKKQNRHTLFMVPTYKNGTGAEVDFDPRETFRRQDLDS
jgi:hypothetical protein